MGFQPEVVESEESRTSRWTFPSERVTPVVAVRFTASEAATSVSTANFNWGPSSKIPGTMSP